jgi:translation initiation factor 5A
MSDDEQHFEGADAGGALVFPMQCSALRKNGYAILKGKPCKIVDMSTSKTGKHGHAKVNLVGIDIFDGKKYEDMSPSTHNMEVPFVSRKEFTLIDVNDEGYLSLMDDAGEIRDDLHCNGNPDLLAEIKKKFDAGEEMLVSVLGAMGREMPMAIKPVAAK